MPDLAELKDDKASNDGPLSAQDVAGLVTKMRNAGHHISEAVAGSLYGSGKTRDEVNAALFAEMARCAEISDICDARGVPEVKAELFASGVAAHGATARIGEAVTIKAAVRTAAQGVYPMTDAEQAKLASDFITKRVTPEHAGQAIVSLAASRDEATAIVGAAPSARHTSSREASAASMARTLKSMGIKPNLSGGR